MVSGIIVTNSGGVPILVREFEPIFNVKTDEKIALLSSIISAIAYFIDKVVKQDVKKIKLGSYYIQILNDNEFMVCLINDFNNPENILKARLILEILREENFGEIVVIDDKRQKELWNKISETLNIYPNISEILKKLYIATKIYLNVLYESTLKGKDLKEKRKVKTSNSQVKMEINAGKIMNSNDFQLLLKELLRFNLKPFREIKNWSFSGVNEDYSKALYIIYKILNGSLSNEMESSELDDLIKVAKVINDNNLRIILLARLNSFKTLSGYSEFEKILLKLKKDILGELSKNSLKGRIYLLVLANYFLASYFVIKDVLNDDFKRRYPHHYYFHIFNKYRLDKNCENRNLLNEIIKLKSELKECEDAALCTLIQRTILAALRNYVSCEEDNQLSLKEIWDEVRFALDLFVKVRSRRELPFILKLAFASELNDWMPIIISCNKKDEKTTFYREIKTFLNEIYREFKVHYRLGKIEKVFYLQYFLKLTTMIQAIDQALNTVNLDYLTEIEELINTNLEPTNEYMKENYWYFVHKSMYFLLTYATKIDLQIPRRYLLTKINWHMENALETIKDNKQAYFFALLYQVFGINLTEDLALQTRLRSIIKTFNKTATKLQKNIIEKVSKCLS